MSSPSPSPSPPQPETPSRRPQAPAKARTPLPSKPSNEALEKPMDPSQPESREAVGGEVQIPSTNPLKSESTQLTQPSKVNSQAQHEEEVQNDHGRSSDAEGEEADVDGYTGPYDWVAFEQDYAKKLQALNEEEDEVIVNFEKFIAAFNTWSEAAPLHDDERISKRLRTRARFVQIQEDSLEQKRKHYTEVVEAFQKAMDLLRGPK